MIDLHNVDCMEILKKLPDNSVDVIITDPPYDFVGYIKRQFHTEFMRVAKHAIVFSPPENQWVKPADQILFWVKPVSTKNTSKNYARFVEMIFVYGEHVWNHDRHWSQYNNVFTDLVESKEHPYKKPLSLMTRLLLNHTNEGDMILDPFMGSGTTGEVCALHNRSFIGVEKDPAMYEIARLNINKASGCEDPPALKHAKLMQDHDDARFGEFK